MRTEEEIKKECEKIKNHHTSDITEEMLKRGWLAALEWTLENKIKGECR